METDNEEYALCFNCAQRLGKYTWPNIPELVLGYCPQCGGTIPLDAAVNVASLTPARAKTEFARQQQVA